MVLGLGENSVFPMFRRLVRFGIGGKMGHGKQFVSWIHETDFCRAVEWLIEHDDFRGPINISAPNPVANAEMMKILREICGVPLGLPAAKWMLELGALVLRTETELIIKSRRVIPGRLLRSGFTFQFPFLRSALMDLQAGLGGK
jgi:NAD dependent epimerase/dehydratase family enzyme